LLDEISYLHHVNTSQLFNEPMLKEMLKGHPTTAESWTWL